MVSEAVGIVTRISIQLMMGKKAIHMSSLTKSLEKRIQELTTSIEAQKHELAAYEKVLAVENGKTDAPQVAPSITPAKHAAEHAAPTQEHTAELSTSAATPDLSEVEFTGNKTNLVAAIVEKTGSAGATPKEVDSVFTERKIARSKNLIYNTLSYLVAQKKLVRRDGRYFVTSGARSVSPKKVGRPAKAAKQPKAAAPVKRRISAEGIKRIREANKKRWAAKKAADQAAAKTAAAKKTPGPKKKAA
jgi:hypothetical protein